MFRLSSLSRAVALFAVTALSACGGGGGGGASSTTSSATEAPTAPPATTAASPATPMSALVVPASMTWDTAAAAAMDVTVRDASGAPAVGAAVNISTQSTVSPHDDQPLRHPVAMELIDAAVTDAAGTARFQARLPAHIDTVLLVGSLGDQSGRISISRADLARPVSIQMSR